MNKILSILAVLFWPAIALASENSVTHAVNPIAIVPFAVLLLSIAALPLLQKHWWEAHYHQLSIGLGTIIIAYYVLFLQDTTSLLHTGMEYISFVSLVGSLFVITGCILLKIDKKATPKVNSAIMIIGAVLANFLGTTGASAFLIRAYLKINKERLKPYHVVFFIFIISNVGGLLTPIGDPPLFLGYLKGVPFFWTLSNLWPMWLIAVGILTAVFYIIDSKNYAEHQKNTINTKKYSNRIVIEGKQNFIFLGIVLLSVFLPAPYREIIMIGSALAAYKTSKHEILDANEFSFGPIKEVAVLFFGIFSCMIPALQWLGANASSLGIKTPGQFYFGSGGLSAVLDNAPTYLNFLSAAFGIKGLTMTPEGMTGFIASSAIYLMAISAGSVFFGAVTYIGNAPNFMVKSIAESSGAETPSFVGYIFKYSLPVLLPIFVLIWFIFLR